MPEALIPATKIESLQKKAAQIQARAAKLGLDIAIKIDILGESVEVVNIDGIPYAIRKIKVHIPDYPPVSIGNWKLVGIVKHCNGANLVYHVGNNTIPSERYNLGPICEHCFTNRPRTTTYIIHNEKEYKTIGRQCLADYLGHPDAASLLASVDTIYDTITLLNQDDLLESEEEIKKSGLIHLPYLLSYTAAYIRKYQWVPASAQSKNKVPSAYIIQDMLFGHNIDAQELREKCFPTETDIATAENAINWASNLNPKSEYEHNIKEIARVKYAPIHYIALACSIIPAYLRTINKPKTESNYIGKIGEKITIKAKLNKVVPYQNQYGITYIHYMTDENNNIIVWFASGKNLYDQIGDNNNYFTISATIKNHEDYKGIKQTIITRAKIIQ